LSQPNLPPEYEFKRVLGRSMLSEVFLVQHESGVLYALKLLRASSARDPRVVERFKREVQLLEDWRHPNLIQGYGALNVDGRPGLLLEFITGPNLKDAVSDRPLRWEQAVRFGVQVSRALDKLHRSGALHRDVKPHNILLDHDRGAILADLGLVRRSTDPALTRQGAALGSPAYMSPEQTRDPSGVGPEADVYSLGATMHHALSGAPPFLGKGVGEVIHRVLHVEPEPLPDDLPESLKKVLATAMAKDPERRYERARDLGGDLGRVLLGLTPHLLTRFKRKKRRRLTALAVAIPAFLFAGHQVVTGMGWLDGNPEENTITEVDGGDPNEESNVGNDANKASPFDVISQRRIYQAWAAPFQDRHRSAFQEGAYRMAWQALGHFEQAQFPTNAEAKFFEQLRRDEIQRGRQHLESMAGETFIDVAEVLQAQAEAGRVQIQSGDFDAIQWGKNAENQLFARVPRAKQLPMFPGDDDPLVLLRSHLLSLERQNRQAWTARGRALVPVLRPQIDQNLRRRNLPDAIQLWSQLDPRLLPYSLEARRESWRLEQLWEAQLQLDQLLQGQLGSNLSLPLPGRDLTGRVRMKMNEDNSVQWQIQTEKGQRFAVNLLDLDARRLAEVISLPPRARSWVEAQILWCQGNESAVKRMTELAVQEWPPQADPYFWAKEWEYTIASEQAQADLGASPSVPTPRTGDGVLTSDNNLKPVPAVSDPLDALQKEIATELIGAQFDVGVDHVKISWSQPSWDPSWLRTWQMDQRKWKIAAWGMEWKIPIGTRPPESFSVWGNVDMNRNKNSWALTSLGKVFDGVYLYPGVRQSLTWNGSELRLDGFTVGKWQVPKGRRISLRAKASDGFQPLSLWVRIEAL
jgi:serine/threonine protein kinase